MLWYKGWLETRFRLLFALVILAFLLVSFSIAAKAPNSGVKAAIGLLEFFVPSAVVVVCAMLSGAGINTQPALQAAKGLHGSTLFTLSLPVSRFRLLVVRASLGWLEMAGAIAALCSGMWMVLPVLRGMVRAVELLEYMGIFIACASTLYFLSVLLATFLDDVWRVWGTMIGAITMWSLPSLARVPAFVNIFRAMGEGSPLLAHTMPWSTMAFSLVLSMVLFLAAMKIARAREY
jgi:hypothetical protein